MVGAPTCGALGGDATLGVNSVGLGSDVFVGVDDDTGSSGGSLASGVVGNGGSLLLRQVQKKLCCKK